MIDQDGAPPAGGVNENAAHDLRGDGEKMRAIPPVGAPGVHQAQVGFMDEARALQRGVAAFLAHVRPRQPTQLVVQKIGQALQGGVAALSPFLQ
jgi:hypothetical protein